MFEKELTRPIGVFNVFIPSIKGYSYHYINPAPSNPSDNANHNQINSASNHNQTNNQINNESLDNQINNNYIPLLPEPNDELPTCPDLESCKINGHTSIYIHPKQFYRVLRRRKIRKMANVLCIKGVNKKRNRNMMMRCESKINICNENDNEPHVKKRRINVNRSDDMDCDDDSDDLHIL
eukprot:285994_1